MPEHKRYSTTLLLTTEKLQINNTSKDNFETILFMPASEGQHMGGLRTKGYFKASYPGKPLISIITVIFNGEQYLEETIQSILNQTYDNVEYIVIDGGSTDGTLDIIKKYDNQIDYWVSEKDSGIYDAMNKGIRMSTGKWLNFLNGGDRYYSNNVLTNIFTQNDTSLYNLIYGDFYIVGRDSTPIRILEAEKLTTKSIKKGMIINHQSIFVRKKHTPLYNLKYKYKAEWNWLIDIIYEQDIKKIFYTGFPIVYYQLGGFSAQGFNKDFKEYLDIKYNRFGINSIIQDTLYILRVWVGFKIRKLLNIDTLRIKRK